MKAWLVVCLAFLAGASGALAQDFGRMSHQQRHDYVQNLSPQEREAFMQKRQSEWEAMDEQKKLRVLEQYRIEKQRRQEAEWRSMSPRDKIRHAEGMLQKNSDESGAGNRPDRGGGLRRGDEGRSAKPHGMLRPNKRQSGE